MPESPKQPKSPSTTAAAAPKSPPKEPVEPQQQVETKNEETQQEETQTQGDQKHGDVVTSSIEVDPQLLGNTTDGESAYESGPASDTTSLAESVFNYQYENGRRFHAFRQGKYNLPNDEQEQDRLDLQSHCIALAFGGRLFNAPLEENPPQKALDLGTGTGLWAIDFADWFPSCEVIGVDLSPIQPSWVPPNMRFEVDDVEDTWHWADNSIDYIHIRDMCYSIREWDHILESSYKALKPGGYIEIQDWQDVFSCDDGTVTEKSALTRWVKALTIAICDVLGAPYYKLAIGCLELFEKHNFIDRHKEVRKMPFGPWAKDKQQKQLGLYMRQWALDTSHGALYALLMRTVGWTLEQCQELTKEIEKDLLNPRMHAYHSIAYCYARKPLDAE